MLTPTGLDPAVGPILGYTVLHGLAFIAFGVIAASLMAMSDREPALFIGFIPAGKLHARQLRQRRIINHAEKFRQDALLDFLRERLALFVAALPLALQPVAKHFVEQHRRRAAREHSWSAEGFGHRRRS